MSFFRRDRDSDRSSIEEYQRSREVFSRIRHEEEQTEAEQEATQVEEPSEEPRMEEKRQESRQPSNPLERYREGATTIARDSAFSGTLNTDGNLFIEGNFQGELEAQATIVIAEGAEVQADVRATDVIIAGTLDGTVDAGRQFHAMPTARVTGEINSAVLVIDEGSHINCKFAMKAGEENR